MKGDSLVRDVLALPPADRLALIHQVWNSLLNDPAGLPLIDEQMEELDRRYEDYLSHPEEGDSWEEVETFVKSRLQQ